MDDRVSIALPSIRADRFKEEFAMQIRKIRKTGFTIAPEAGSQRLRNIINKNLNEDDILSAAKTAYDLGWDHIKLYFMIGLPFETEEDLREMVKLTEKIARMKRKGYVVLSASSFVPKPHTPFQWAKQITLEEIEEKQRFIKSLIKSRNVKFRYHDSGQSLIEGIMARGDRKAGDLIEYVFNKGGRFDGWGECFKLSLWQEAVKETNYDYSNIHNGFDTSTVFPWDFINTAIAKNYYLKEWEKAVKEETTPYCDSLSKCNSCKACSPSVLKSRFKFKENIENTLQTESAKAVKENKKETSNEEMRLIYLFSYTKLGLIKFISHLDLKTVLVRGLKIANLPVSYTKGFNPRPIINFAPALELGIEGENEYFIAELKEQIDENKIVETLTNALPNGLNINFCKKIPFEKRNILSNDAITDYLVVFDKTPTLTNWKETTYEKKTKKGYKTVLIADYINSVEKINNTAYLISTYHSQQKGSMKITEIIKHIFENCLENNVKIVRKQIKYNEDL